MPLQINGKTIGNVFYGSTQIAEVYRGSTLVWQNVPKVTITGTSGTQARDSFRAALAERGLDYNTVETVPFSLDTSNVTSMESMFQACYALKSVPDMDTSNVTKMKYMFHSCSSLTSVPDMNTSKVTDMYGMFRSCSSLTLVSDMNTSNATDVRYMFQNCRALTDGNVRCIGKRSGVYISNMIVNSGLTRLPFYDVNGNWTG